MTEPLTWRVLEYVQQLVQRIRITDGYYTDMGADVRLSAWIPERASAPRVHIVSVSDTLNDGELRGRGLRGPRDVRGEMQVVVEYVLPASMPDAQKIAHRGRADLVSVLRDDPALCPRGVTGLAITNRQILDQPDGLPVVVSQVTLSVSIYETTAPLDP